MVLIYLNPYLAEDRQKSLQGPVEVVPGGRREKGNKSLFEFREFLWDGVYLFLPQCLQLFRLALPVVFHDHHGGVDFAHRQVCGCWENDKLPCKIRPEWDGTLSRGGEWEWGTRHTTTTTTNSQQHAEYTSNWAISVSCPICEIVDFWVSLQTRQILTLLAFPNYRSCQQNTYM